MADPLGDGISSVELINHMGDDLMVINAARVSFAKESEWALQFNRLKAKDERLIQYLAEHGHWTPFSQPQLQFRIKMPIFVARQWYKHSVGLTRNEISRRYVDFEPEVYVPKTIRPKPTDNRKQGSDPGEHLRSVLFRSRMNHLMGEIIGTYNTLIQEGVAPEQARMILPQSTYTEFIETGSLAAYARIARLRIAPDAQEETRLYAEAVSSLIEPLFPVSWEALNAKAHS